MRKTRLHRAATLLLSAGLLSTFALAGGGSAQAAAWEGCAGMNVVSYAGTHLRISSLEGREASCTTAESVVRSFYSQEIGSSGATMAEGFGCAYEERGAAVLCESYSGGGYDGPVGVRWREHEAGASAGEGRVASCRSFTLFSGRSQSDGRYKYRATAVQRSADIRCGRTRKLLKAAYGMGPLKVVRTVRPAVGRPTYWLRGGWRCSNGAGGAACWNAHRPELNVIRLEGLSHGLAVMASVDLARTRSSRTAATARPRYLAAPEPMNFGTYGAARVGDTPAEVRRKIPGMEPCHLLSGICVCASVEVGERSVVFVYRLDRSSRVDLIFTSSSAVPGPRGIRVGDGVNKLKRLFPHVHRRPPIYGTQRFVVNKGRIGLMAHVRGGRISQLTTGRNRFFHYVEYCS